MLFDAIVMAVHIVAAATFVGPQILLTAVMPGIRSLEDVRSRQQVTRVVTTWFGILGGVALVVLLATGAWNLIESPYFPNRRFGRYYVIVLIKVTLVTIVAVLTVAHGAVFGRRMRQLQEKGASEEEIGRVRRWSMSASMATLVCSVIILVCAGLLRSDWSHQPT